MDGLCVFLFGCLVIDTYDNLLLIFFPNWSLKFVFHYTGATLD